MSSSNSNLLLSLTTKNTLDKVTEPGVSILFVNSSAQYSFL